MGLNCKGDINDLSVLLEDNEREEPSAEYQADCREARPSIVHCLRQCSTSKALFDQAQKKTTNLEPLQHQIWSSRNLNARHQTKTICHHDEAVPDLFGCHDLDILCEWLCRFLLETRQEDGKPHPPSTLRLLISGINRALKAKNIPYSVRHKSDY